MGAKHFREVGDERLEQVLELAMAHARERGELVVGSYQEITEWANENGTVSPWAIRGRIQRLITFGKLGSATTKHGPVTRLVTIDDVLYWVRHLLSPEQRREIGQMDGDGHEPGSGARNQRDGCVTGY